MGRDAPGFRPACRRASRVAGPQYVTVTVLCVRSDSVLLQRVWPTTSFPVIDKAWPTHWSAGSLAWPLLISAKLYSLDETGH